MEKKNKKQRKFAIVLLIMVVICIAVSVLALPSFAMPSYNSGLLYPSHSYSLKLGETLTGVATGKYFVIPDAWSGSAVGTPSAGVNAVTSSHTFTNDQYTTVIRNGSRTIEGVVYNQYSQIYCSTSGSTGSVVVTPYENYQNYEPLLSAYDMYVDTTYDDVAEISFKADGYANQLRMPYRIVLCGYDGDGVYHEWEDNSSVTVGGNETDAMYYYSMMHIINHSVSRLELQSAYLQFDGYIKVKEFAVWLCDANVTTYRMHKLNYANLWSDYRTYNDSFRSDVQKWYSDAVSQWIMDMTQSGEAQFINSRWIDWAIGSVAGVMNVKIFGDAVNFTLGGLVGSVVAIGFIAAMIKMFGR